MAGPLRRGLRRAWRPVPLPQGRGGGGNLEAAARRVRYQAFDELLGPGDLLLLGHHRDDQAETLLLRMLQGRGVAAMPGSRRLAGGAMILRPFLAVSRSEILTAAEDLGADFLNDPSNAEPALDRNFSAWKSCLS